MEFIPVGLMNQDGDVSLYPLWLEILLSNKTSRPELEKYKFAVVGILGDSNSGKSFLMNAMAEYLRREKGDDHKWIDNQQVKNLPGFAMHEDRLNHNISDGIYMWPRPFILKKPCDKNDHESIAILLLDINTNKVNPALEVLMSLLCSTLIYNKTSSECPDISEILKIRSEILKCRPTEGKLHPKDIVFQHLMVVFRDSKLKSGKGKSLKYLTEIMNMENNIQWKEELEKIPSKSCFLLKQPFAENGQPEFDKTFISQLKALAKDMLTIDDLPLKTLKNVEISLKDFMSNNVYVDMFIPNVVKACTMAPYLETNLDEVENMDVDGDETSRRLATNGDEEVEMEVDTEDHEKEDLSETSKEASNKSLPPSPAVALQKSKLPEHECKELIKDFLENPVTKPDDNQKPVNMSFPCNKEVICVDFEQRIENILQNATKELESNFSESEQSQSIEEIIECFRNDAKMNIEKIFASCSISTPAGLLRDTEGRLDAIIHETKKIWPTRNSNAEKSNTTSNVDAELPKENLHNDSEIASEFTNYVTEALRSYSKKMVDFISSGKYTKEDQKQFYDELAAAIITQVITYWVGRVTIDDNMINQILRKLEESCRSDVERHDHIQNSVEETWKCFDKTFSKESDNLVKSGDFVRKEAEALFDDILNTSLPSMLPYFDRQEVFLNIKNSPKAKKCIHRLKNVQTCAKQIASEMKRTFQLYNFFEEEKFSKILEEIEVKVLKDKNLDDVEGKIFNSTLRVIRNECKTINKNIIINEKKILKNSVILRITNIYNEEMKTLTQNRMSLADLRNAHEKLKKECIEAVKKSCSYNDNNYRHLKSSFQKIEVSLENAFETYKSGNELKKDIFMAKENLVVKKTHDNYIHSMTNKLKQKTMTQSEIEELHKATLNEASIVLKKDLMAYQENSDIHIQKLALLTKRNFDFFIEENQKRIREEEKIKELGKREKLKQEALDKKEKLTKERRDTAGESNGNSNSSIHKPMSPLSERSSAHRSSNGNFSGDISADSKTISVEFGMRTVKCGIMVDGKLTIVPDKWGHKEFPNIIAITYDDEILIGHEVSRFESKFQFFWKMANMFFTPLEEVPPEVIQFRGRDVVIKKELLCGLILSRIKSDAETFLNSSVDSLALTIPLCYSSSQRKAAKDAAIIGGFSTVRLITEPTAAALAYARHSSRIKSNNHFLVVVADSDYMAILDAAVYHYIEGKVKMVSCAGNLHHNVPGRVKKYIKKVANWFENSTTEKEVIHSYLKECIQHKDIKEFALICSPGQHKSNILKMIIELCKDARPATQPEEDVAILTGAAIFTELGNGEEKGMKPYISDLLPYQFECHRELLDSAVKTKIIFPRADALPVTERMQSFTFENSRCLKYRIYETGKVIEFSTGDLVVPINSPTGQKRKGAIYFIINSEGILRITATYTDPKEEIVINYFPVNMSEEKIAENASLVSFVAPNPRLAEEKRLFNDAKSELRSLAEFILANLTQVESVFGKDQMEKRASASIEALRHPKISQEDVSNRIAVLTKLKSKYLK